MRSFMRVPRLFLNVMDLIAGSMTSLDHPEELPDYSDPDDYEWLLKSDFYSWLLDSSESIFMFLRGFLPQLGFYFLISPSISLWLTLWINYSI